ncbi:ATP-binding protein [Algoriphagus sp. SE2]|uniref:AlbA family DNA-binding domain-containing protein n=1 Tax=Algoriphagus sp. SE2 TaxID=3141536 RepID=UPI0031CD9F49
MTLQEVRNLASKGEGLRIEFKKKAAYPEKIVKEFIALANTAGGVVMIGVDDDGTVSGQRFIEEEIYVMEKAIRELIFPSLSYELISVPINAKKGIAIFKLEQSPNRPHYLKINNKRHSFIRVEDRSVQASIEVWEILKRSKSIKDMVFTYGRKEEILLKAIEQKGKITLKEFSKLARIPKFLASKTLVRLVLANVLRIHPQESEDYFTLKEVGA